MTQIPDKKENGKMVQVGPGIQATPLGEGTGPPAERFNRGAAKPWVPPGGRAPQRAKSVANPKGPNLKSGPGYDNGKGWVGPHGDAKGYTPAG